MGLVVLTWIEMYSKKGAFSKLFGIVYTCGEPNKTNRHMGQGRTLVIGDIHSGLRALKQLLERAHLTTDDQLIFLGDYVDGWSEAVETIDYLLQLDQEFNCRFIRGNHDELCKDWLLEKKHNPNLAHARRRDDSAIL